jgi:nitric oxide reductase activation protein
LDCPWTRLIGATKALIELPSTSFRLREVEQMLLKKQDFLEEKIKHEMDIIKKNGTTNKRASLQALKRKKRIEKQLEQLDGTF